MSTIVTTGAATGSSGTTYISGASGFDSSALIAASVEARMQPAYRLDVQIAELEAEVAAYEEMLTLMTDLAGAAESLSGVSDGSVYETYAGYLTAPGLDDPQRYLTATVTDGAGPGSYEIVVDQLAQGMKVASTEQSGETALGLDGTFNLAADGYAGADISVTGDMSLSDIADTINAASAETGVVATMIRTSDRGYTLTLSTVDTGASLTASAVSGDDVLQALGFTDAGGAFANQLQAAQDAVFTLDGVTVTSSSNEIEDLIPGVSINLYGTSAGEAITLEVGQDLSAVRASIDGFVEAFNAYRTFALNQQATLEGQGAAEAATLFGDSLLRNANTALYDVMETSVELDGVAYTLADIGITYGAGNMLTIDDAALEEALLQRPEVVEAFFASQTTSTSPDLGVSSLSSDMASGTYTVDVDTDATTGEILSASINGVPMDVSGSSIMGPDGTAYEGLRLVYTGSTSASIQLDVSQGLADQVIGTVDQYASGNDALIADKIETLNANIDDKQGNRDDIAQSAAQYEQYLVEYYARLEQEIALSNLMLDQLEALFANDND